MTDSLTGWHVPISQEQDDKIAALLEVSWCNTTAEICMPSYCLHIINSLHQFYKTEFFFTTLQNKSSYSLDFQPSRSSVQSHRSQHPYHSAILLWEPWHHWPSLQDSEEYHKLCYLLLLWGMALQLKKYHKLQNVTPPYNQFEGKT